MKKYLALFLAALMLLSLAAGCALTGSDTQTDKPETSPTPATTDGGDSDLDLAAAVAEIGDETITLGDVKETFDSYVEYFSAYGYNLSSDPETLAMLLDDVVNSLVEAKLIAAKAKEMGYDKFDELNWTSALKPSSASWMHITAHRPNPKRKATPPLMWMHARWSSSLKRRPTT